MMNYCLFIVFLVLCIFFNGVACRKPKKQKHYTEDDGKIVGGNVTVIQEVPYQAFLLLQRYNEIFQCGGSIISEKYILTAAHCLSGMESAIIRIGSSDSDVGGIQYFSTKLRQHPLYNALNSDFDVGLVNVGEMTLDGVNARAVRLPDKGAAVEIGSQILVTGWGTTSENGLTSEVLRAVEVPVVSQSECRKSYPTLTARQFCAGFRDGGKDSCQGDSGGPAVTQSGVQVGVVSYGAGCARPNYPGVYTKISSVRSFIHLHAGV